MVKNKSDRMYSHRRENIGIVEGCPFNCIYCQFRKLQRRFGKGEDDINYVPHYHLERLLKKPLLTNGIEFVTIGLNGDISCASDEVMGQVIQYCTNWKDRTFLLQTKNPERLIPFKYPDNVIIGITLETNRDRIWGRGEAEEAHVPKDASITSYDQISKAPLPHERFINMCFIVHKRKMVTIEPILDFDMVDLIIFLKYIAPERVYIGYDSGNYKLPEPPLQKTKELVEKLRAESITVFEKLLRPAWYEKMEGN